MAKDGFLKRHGIVRNAIKKDMLYFALPWVIVWTGGLWVCAKDLIREQGSLYVLSVQSGTGLALLAFGFSILITAQITLRKSYASTLIIWENHQLKTHGIYRLVRHPIYLGVILGSMGIAVYASSLYGFLIMSANVPVFLIRIKIEEKLLTKEFGDAYRMYKKKTKKLLPFIY